MTGVIGDDGEPDGKPIWERWTIAGGKPALREAIYKEADIPGKSETVYECVCTYYESPLYHIIQQRDEGD